MSEEVNELKQELTDIRRELQEIKAALVGPLGMTGLIGTISLHERRIRSLENDRWLHRGVAAAVGVIASALWQWLSSR